MNGLMGTPFNTIEKADRKKKVLIIGGGPAGMEAARVSAIRGHNVTIYEKSNKLGGLLHLAAIVKGFYPENLLTMINYFKGQIARLGIKTQLSQEADLSVISNIKPDVVFLAAGGLPTVPDIPGINKPNVVNSSELHRMLKLLLKFFSPKILRRLSRLYMPIGKKVVIIGGAIQGCELAEFLTKRGRQVTIVDKTENMGEGMTIIMKEYLFIWFDKRNVRLISGVKEYVEINDIGLIIINRDGIRQIIEADTIIPVHSMSQNTELLNILKKHVPEVYAIGDCKEPHLIADAIGAAIQTAREI